MLDVIVVSLFFSMVLAPCVVASFSSHLEAKMGSAAVNSDEPSGKAQA